MEDHRNGDRRIVAICGHGPITRHLVHEQEPFVELWGLVDGFEWMPRWDRWYEFHQAGVNAFQEEQDKVESWLIANSVPVYMFDVDPRFPHSVRYPYEDITARFAPFFTSTLAYMMAHAIHEGVDEIRLIGCEMQMMSEYEDQREAMSYWMGVAAGLGIDVWQPPQGTFLRAPQYGRIKGRERLSRGEVYDILLKLRTDQQAVALDYQRHDGAISVLQQILDKFAAVPEAAFYTGVPEHNKTPLEIGAPK